MFMNPRSSSKLYSVDIIILDKTLLDRCQMMSLSPRFMCQLLRTLSANLIYRPSRNLASHVLVIILPAPACIPENHRKTAEIKGKGSNNREACFPNLDVTLREAERIVCPLDDITQEDGAFFPGPLHAHSIFPWRLSKTHKFDRPHFTGKWIGSAAAE